jgi:hypothetical protein
VLGPGDLAVARIVPHLDLRTRPFAKSADVLSAFADDAGLHARAGDDPGRPAGDGLRVAGDVPGSSRRQRRVGGLHDGANLRGALLGAGAGHFGDALVLFDLDPYLVRVLHPHDVLSPAADDAALVAGGLERDRGSLPAGAGGSLGGGGRGSLGRGSLGGGRVEAGGALALRGVLEGVGGEHVVALAVALDAAVVVAAGHGRGFVGDGLRLGLHGLKVNRCRRGGGGGIGLGVSGRRGGLGLGLRGRGGIGLGRGGSGSLGLGFLRSRGRIGDD